jgi:hypothetical protein
MIHFDRLKQRSYSTGGTGLLSVGRAEIAEVNEDLPFIWQENTARSRRGVFRGAIDNPAIIAPRI